MNAEPHPTVRVVRPFAFAAERVFDAWLDPAIAAKWLFATPTGEMVRAEIDPRVGGKFTFVDRRGAEDIEHTGEYLEIQRPSRLAFTFGVPKYSSDFVRVTIDIISTEGGCELTLTQSGTPSQWVNRTQDGWIQILHGLAATIGELKAITNRVPGQFTVPGEVRFVRLLPGPIERVWDYLTDSEKRGKWFASGPRNSTHHDCSASRGKGRHRVRIQRSSSN